MVCPICNNPLKTIEYHGQTIDICIKCAGMWFDEGELNHVINSMLSKDKVSDQTIKEAYKRKVLASKEDNIPLRNCPRCNITMNTFNYAYDSNVFLDKCPSCKGIWTDSGEARLIAKHIKGNPDITKYAKAIVAIQKKRSRIASRKAKAIALGIACFYLIFSSWMYGLAGFLLMLRFLILPLACIFFGYEMGTLTGVRFSLNPIRPVVNKPTPGMFVILIGWVLLFLPIIATLIMLYNDSNMFR